ncbi:MAG: FGGY-family carbohydrate kinase, partial [Deltaproteobacteria bacterium]|nr:FGGY-family carbohydrate kinase [Deltaproteobacteria bacterium]
MSATYLLGLDVGGGGGRCLLVDAESGASLAASRRWEHPVVEGTGGTGSSVDLPGLWRKLGEASREVMARAGAKPGQVAGVSASAMRFGSVVVDGAGEAIQSGPNRDARGAGEAIALAVEHGEGLAAATGHWPAPIMPAARLLHLKKNDPAGFERAASLLALNDWLIFRLCGAIATDASMAGSTGLYRADERGWAWEWIDRLGLPRELFPEVRDAGGRAGELSTDAAEVLGLAAGTPVGIGGGDTQCGLLGSGVTAAGGIGAVAGTTTPVQLVCAQRPNDPEFRLWVGHHVVPGLWVAESNAGPTGEVLDWVGRFLAPDAPNPAARVLAEAATEPPGARGLRSTLGAQVGNARALSLPVGDLTICHMATEGEAGRPAFARAVVEGMAFALRGNVEPLLEIGGAATHPALHMTGGMSRSDIWNQLAADVLERPVRVGPQPEATSLGAAICAGVAAGVFESLERGAAALAEP